MGLRINTNVQSLVAQHRLESSHNELNHVQDKLATGSNIIQAKDDAAGLAISENIRAQVRATGQNIKNAQNGFFLLQTAEGGLNEITNIVIRMKELAVQASSDTNGDKERGYLDNEYQELKRELDRIANTTSFNGRNLLGGETGELQVQVGPNNDDFRDRVALTTDFDARLETLGMNEFAISSGEGARDTLEQTEAALSKLARIRGQIGGSESRLSSVVANLTQYEENSQAAFSQIRDADIAKESSNFAKYNILNQAGVAVLSQANSVPQLALKLLQG